MPPSPLEQSQGDIPPTLYTTVQPEVSKHFVKQIAQEIKDHEGHYITERKRRSG